MFAGGIPLPYTLVPFCDNIVTALSVCGKAVLRSKTVIRGHWHTGLLTYQKWQESYPSSFCCGPAQQVAPVKCRTGSLRGRFVTKIFAAYRFLDSPGVLKLLPQEFV